MEMIVLFPLLILLTVWMFSAFKNLRAAQVSQRAAYTNLVMRMDNRSQPSIDGLGQDSSQIDTPVDQARRYFMAVEHLPNEAANQGRQADGYSYRIEDGSALYGGSSAALTTKSYRTIVGICFHQHSPKCL